MQTNANQTRDHLDKHDSGKKLQKSRGKAKKNAPQKKARKMQTKCKKMQIRPGTNWTNMISEKKNAKLR
jgi:hypothetical protein